MPTMTAELEQTELITSPILKAAESLLRQCAERHASCRVCKRTMECRRLWSNLTPYGSSQYSISCKQFDKFKADLERIEREGNRAYFRVIENQQAFISVVMVCVGLAVIIAMSYQYVEAML